MSTFITSKLKYKFLPRSQHLFSPKDPISLFCKNEMLEFLSSFLFLIVVCYFFLKYVFSFLLIVVNSVID